MDFTPIKSSLPNDGKLVQVIAESGVSYFLTKKGAEWYYGKSSLVANLSLVFWKYAE